MSGGIALAGPVSLPSGSYDYDDLKSRLPTALAGDDPGRAERVFNALKAARIYAGGVVVAHGWNDSFTWSDSATWNDAA